MSEIRILHLITGLKVGGAEKVVYDLSCSQKRMGYEVFVVGISDKTHLKQMFIDAGLKVRTLNIVKSFYSFITGFKELVCFVKNNEIKIIHAHMSHALIIAVLLKIFIGKLKIVFTSHSFNLGSTKREFLIKILKPFREIDIIFSRSMWKNIYKKNAFVIPNGIDTALYNLDIAKNNTFTFLCIGRIEIVKNHKILVDIAVELEKEFEFEIHIVGEGYLKAELVNDINTKNVDSKFKFLGYRKDINVICNQSHVFLLPSLWEGLPISLLEAGASKLPVIATPVGSIPDLIDNDSGYLSEVKYFAEKMKEIYLNYNLALEKASVLREKILEKYDLNNIVSQHDGIYKSLLK